MRVGLVALLLISTPAIAQQQAIAPMPRGQPVPYIRPPAGTVFMKPFEPRKGDPSPDASERMSRYITDVKSCISSYDPILNRVTVNVRIGSDGRIVGEPDAVSPIDSDEFRNDVATVVRKLHQCEPFQVPPSKNDTAGFTELFTFGAKHLDTASLNAMLEHFKKCRPKPPTGPDVVVELRYNADGTYAAPPQLVEPQDNTEYMNAATQLIDQLNKCPPMEIPDGKAGQFAKFRQTFGALDKN